MANRSLEQMMVEEQQRVTRGTAGVSKPAGLLDLVRPSAGGRASPSPALPKPTIATPAPASPAVTFSRAAQTLAATPIKTGYTVPTPALRTPAHPAATISRAAETLVAAPIKRSYSAPAPAAPVSPAMTISKAAQTLAASPINKGYTAPVPVPQIPPPAPSSGGGVAGEIGKTALKFFSSGLGVMPLISGVAGLFGGGTPAPPPLVKYAMPRSIQVTAANSTEGGSFQFADHGQDGTVRSYNEISGGSNPASGGSTSLWPAAGQNAGGGPASQVVVNIQAMDSRSFLDHSQEIAQAVRDAMLNMHALNDVVSEL